jgi:hypothetical protein
MVVVVGAAAIVVADVVAVTEDTAGEPDGPTPANVRPLSALHAATTNTTTATHGRRRSFTNTAGTFAPGSRSGHRRRRLVPDRLRRSG